MVRWSLLGEQVRQTGQDIVVPQPASCLDRQALLSVLIDHGEHSEGFAVMRPGLNEVVSPDMVPPARP